MQLERLKVIENLCNNPHVVISGSSDYNPMAQLVGSSPSTHVGKLAAIRSAAQSN